MSTPRWKDATEVAHDLSRERLPVELVPHSPGWAQRAQEEAGRFKSVLGDVLVAVHHIGSTSIPGILAKPIVDLMPLVTSLEALDAHEVDVVALGYEWWGEYGLAGRRYCKRNDPLTGKRIFNIHFYDVTNPGIARHLAFRDYLRAHPEIAKAYEAEKVRAAKLQPDDTLAYNAEKNDWIKRVEAEALAWAARNP